MRWQSAWAFLALCGGAVFAGLSFNHISSQETTLAKAQERRPADSLEFGPAFSEPARQEFEAQLTSAERERLIRLKSRSILASPDFPLPTHEPVQPFYIKLRGPLSAALAGRLSAAGGSFVGYANPHTHIVRAVDAQSLTRIGALLRTEPMAAGTALQHTADKCSRGLWESLAAAPITELNILLWRDASEADAAALLQASRAVVLESVGGAEIAPGPDNPLLRVRVDAVGASALLASPLLENLAPAGWKVAENQTSVGIANADPATIGVAPYNLDGTNQIVGVWDGGAVRDTHEQFQNAPTPSLINNGTKRVRKVDGAANDDHGTHVAGTIIGDGTNRAQAKGFAPKAYVLSHDWNSIESERRSAKHNYNHVADNHSYADFNGGSDDWGDYTSGTQTVDRSNRDFLMCQVQSAGNYQSSQPTGSGTKPFTGGTCTVPSYNAHRNGFIIGAAKDNKDITTFSSLGPALDGRLVPQFCANGEGLESSTAGSNTSYASYSGTSMSGPSFCGGVTLLAQLWRREHADQLLAPDVARSAIALTCQDRGNAGPDYIYGFGIIDVQAAADLMLADKTSGGKRIVRGQVRQGGVVEYPVTVSSSATPLRVVCSWLDIFASTTAATTLVNDLDLELVDPSGGVHYPFSGVLTCAAGSKDHVFTATAANRRDNLELAEVASPATGTWLVRVRGFSIPATPQTGYPNAVQGFVLAASHNLGAQKLFVDDAVNGGTAVSIPDNNTTGITRTFAVADARVIAQVRVHARIMHERRGDLRIVLAHPDGTQVVLKTVNSGDNNTYTDIIGVYPDTRQHNDDVTTLLRKAVSGNWTINISDRASGSTGTLNYLALELDVRTNVAPVAAAGTDFSVREGENSQLAGSGTDADGDPVAYTWSQTGGAVTVTLGSTTVANPTFTAPAVSADAVVTFQLQAKDPGGLTHTDSVQVTIRNNQSPVASAGSNFALLEGAAGGLDASGTTDPEGDAVTYAWAQLSGLPLVLSAATAAKPSFTAPAVTQDEIVVFELTATDAKGDSATSTVQVTIEDNVAPVANAGPDQGAVHGATVALDGSASSDPNTGDSLAYAWAQVGGTSTVTLAGATTATPGFTAPATDDTLEFELTVTDAAGLTHTDRVRVFVNATGAVPVPPKGGGGGKKDKGGCAAGPAGGSPWALLAALALLAGLRRARRRA